MFKTKLLTTLWTIRLSQLLFRILLWDEDISIHVRTQAQVWMGRCAVWFSSLWLGYDWLTLHSFLWRQNEHWPAASQCPAPEFLRRLPLVLLLRPARDSHGKPRDQRDKWWRPLYGAQRIISEGESQEAHVASPERADARYGIMVVAAVIHSQPNAECIPC